MTRNRKLSNEKGSLSLEQVLFIGAIVAMSTGLYAFYGDLSDFFTNFDVSGVSGTVPAP